MAILRLYSLAEELGLPASANDTTVGVFDANWADSAIVRANNVAGPTLNGDADTNYTDLWYHFEVYASSVSITGSSTDGVWWSITCPSAGTTGFFIQARWLNGSLIYEVSQNSNFSSATTLGSISTPFYQNLMSMDIRVRINSAGNDIVDIYHNGTLFGSLSRANSGTGALRVGPLNFSNFDSNSNIYYSQLMVADESTIGLKMVRMNPNAAGDNSDFEGDFNNLLLPFDGGAISTSVAGNRESWNLEAYGGPATPGGIRGVFLTSYATLGPDAVAVTGFEHFLRISATNYDGAKITPVAGTQHITEWANNPATASPWAVADFAALIGGVEAVA